MRTEASYRQPAAAGRFYPAEPEVLARRVDEYLAGAPRLPSPGPLGLISPHAGYDYSGSTAGHAYREVTATPFDAILVVGPSHYDRFPGASVWPGRGYQTPLGPADHPETIVRRLEEAASGIRADRLGHREEHSVEVQIPFLQRAAPGTPILPIVLADDRPAVCRELAEILAGAAAGMRVLFVASSDLYHGYSHAECERTDEVTIAAILRNDPDELGEGFRRGRYQACGRGPIQVVLTACRRLGAAHVELLGRTNSDEVMGGEGGYVVGYAALAVTRGSPS